MSGHFTIYRLLYYASLRTWFCSNIALIVIYISFFIITYYVQRLKIILLYYYNFHISHCLFLWYSKVKCVALMFVGELHQHWRCCGGPPGTVAEGVYSECRPRKGPRYESPVWEFSTFIVLVLNFCSIL